VPRWGQVTRPNGLFQVGGFNAGNVQWKYPKGGLILRNGGARRHNQKRRRPLAKESQNRRAWKIDLGQRKGQPHCKGNAKMRRPQKKKKKTPSASEPGRQKMLEGQSTHFQKSEHGSPLKNPPGIRFVKAQGENN